MRKFGGTLLSCMILFAASPSFAAPPAPAVGALPEETVRQLLQGVALPPAPMPTEAKTDGTPAGAPPAASESEQRLAEEKKKRDALFFSEILPLAESLMKDGDLSEKDTLFLANRARDLGYAGSEAEDAAARALTSVRRRGDYASILKAALADAYLDASENELLKRKRLELEIPEAWHAALQETLLKELGARSTDLFGQMKETSLTTELLDRSLELYGKKLFSAAQGAPAPSASPAPSDDYPIGAGDVFHVYLWGRLEASYVLTVDRDGNLPFPQIGPLHLEGLTYAEARRLVQQKAKSIVGADATVALSGTRTIGVFVVGEVENPGLVTVSPSTSAIEALMKAGGPTSMGSLRHVKVKRGKRTLAEADLYGFITDGEPGLPLTLKEGDVLVVPRAERLVELRGEVRRPAIYELLESEGLPKLIALGGGLTPEASAGRIQVARNESNRKKIVLDVGMPDLKEGFRLLGGDIVRVFPYEGETSNGVRLLGDVYQGGNYAHKEGMRVSTLIGDRSNLKEGVDLEYAVLLRQDAGQRRREVQVFSLGKALASPGSDQDPPLLPQDEVYVFSADRFKEPPKAFVSGEVRTPGFFRIEKGARVGDLLRMAGGVTEEGYLPKGEIVRRDAVTGELHTLYIDLTSAIRGDAGSNIELLDGDQLKVYTIPTVVPKQYVFISGEINAGKLGAGTLSSVGRFVGDLGGGAGELAREKRREERHINALRQLQTGSISTLPETFDERENMRPGAPLVSESLRVLLTKGMRVSDLVFKAGGVTRDAYPALAHIYRTHPQTKEMVILPFDLGKALALDPAQNLELADQDQVLIYSAYDFKPRHNLEVAGSVVNPGIYPFSDKMTVRDLLLIAGGLKEDAFLYSAELARHRVDETETGKTEVVTLDLSKVMADDSAHNLALRPYDKLYVRQIRDWNRDRKVRLEGEVIYPGVYRISKGEKLSSVIRRAGGFTERAHLAGAFFSRESAKLNQESRLAYYRRQLDESLMISGAATAVESMDKTALDRSQRSIEMQRALLKRMENVRATGRIVIKLAPLAQLEGSVCDLPLEDNDYLSIPLVPATVEVLGAVNNPTSLLWDAKNPGLSHYLAMAGGPTATGDEERIYVIKADGSVVGTASSSNDTWWGESGMRGEPLSPGDTVLVPNKIPEPSALSEIAQVTQVLYQIGIAAGVMIAIF